MTKWELGMGVDGAEAAESGVTSPWWQQHMVVLASLATVLLATLFTVLSVGFLGGNLGHAAGHLSGALPLIGLMYVWLRRAPGSKPTRVARANRNVTLLGLLLVAVSLVVEAGAAFGYRDPAPPVKMLQSLHNSSWVLQFPGAALVLLGAVLGLASLAQKGSRAEDRPTP